MALGSPVARADFPERIWSVSPTATRSVAILVFLDLRPAASTCRMIYQDDAVIITQGRIITWLCSHFSGFRPVGLQLWNRSATDGNTHAPQGLPGVAPAPATGRAKHSVVCGKPD